MMVGSFLVLYYDTAEYAGKVRKIQRDFYYFTMEKISLQSRKVHNGRRGIMVQIPQGEIVLRKGNVSLHWGGNVV